MKRVIMTIGLNHSGKSTFANKLAGVNESIVVVEGDRRRQFAESEFKHLYDTTRDKYEFDDPNLKIAYLKWMSKFAIDNGTLPVLAVSNTYAHMRKLRIEYFHSCDRSVLGIWCNPSHQILRERADKITKEGSKDESLYSRGIVKNLEWQIGRFEEPSATEFDAFIEFSDPEEVHIIVEQVNKVIS